MAKLFSAKKEVTEKDAKKLKNLAGFKKQEAKKHFGRGMRRGIFLGAGVVLLADLAVRAAL